MKNNVLIRDLQFGEKVNSEKKGVGRSPANRVKLKWEEYVLIRDLLGEKVNSEKKGVGTSTGNWVKLKPIMD